MEPDPDGPFQRAERTLVSVWCYITEAVSRFLRPQTVEATDNNPTSSDEPGVDGEADGSLKDDDARGVEVGEEASLSTVSLVSLSSPVVAWERCTADIDLKPKEEDHENKEDLVEEQLGKTGNDFAGQLVTESAKVHQGSQDKTDIDKCDTCEESLAPENDGQHATGGSGHGWVKEGVFEDMDSREIRPRDHQKVLETLADIEEEAEEKSEEKSNEKTGDQKVNKASAAILGDANISEDASQLSSGNENFSDEKTKDVETQLRQLSEDEKVQMSVSEEAATAEELEQVKSGQTTEDILTQNGTSSKDVQETEPDTTEYTIREEDVLVTIMKTAEEDVTMEEISADLDYEMAEGKNLSAENENSAEQTQQVETRQLVCKELSGVAEDERIEEEKDDRSATHEEENILNQSATSSEDDEDTGEEQFKQTDSDQSFDEAKEDVEEECSEIQEDDAEETEKDFEEKSEVPGNDEEEATVGSEHVQLKEDVTDRIESSEEEEHVRLDDRWKVLETLADIVEDDEEEAEEDSEEESKMQESTPTKEEECSNEKTEEERDNRASAAMLEDANLSEGASQLNFSDQKTKVETLLPVCKDELTDINVQMTVFGNEDLNQTTDEELEEDKNRRTIEEEKIEFTFKEDDVTSMQTAEEDVTMEEISADLDYEMAEGKNLSAENENSAEQTQQVETRQLVCKELSGVAEDERIEEEKDERSVTHEESEDRKSSRGDEDVQQEENVLAQSVTSSEDDQEQFILKGNDSAEQLINENMTEHQLGLEKKLHTSAGTEVIKNKEENTANEANYEELEKRGDGDVVGEESVSRKRVDEVAKVDEVKEELEEESDEIQTDDREKNEEEFKEESEAEQFTTDGDTGEQREGENTAANQQTTEESENDKSRRTNEEENISTQSVTISEIDQRTEEEQFSQTGNDSGDQLITEDMTTHQLGLETTEIQNLHTCEEIGRVENKGFQEERGETQEDNRDEDFMKEEREEQKEGEAGPVILGDANIWEDASKLKSENENSAERTEQVETQHFVCKELSGVVEEEESVTCEEAEQDKGREVEDVQQDKNILNQSATSSEDDQDTGEEQFNQTDSDQSSDEAKEDVEEECSEIQEDDAEETEKDFEEKSEVPGNDEEEATVGSEHVQLKEDVTDGIESSEEEEHVRLDDRWKVLETLADIVEDDEEEAEEDSEEESKMQESTPTKEEECGNEKTEEERDNRASAAMLEDANLSEDASQLNFSDQKTKVETLLPVSKDELTDINVQMTVFGNEDLNQTTDEELEEDKNRRTIEEEKIEFTFKEDDVTSMQTATEKEMTVEEISADVEERLSDKEICMKRVCTTAPLTVKAGGESEREINIGFSEIPSGVIEGQAGLSHELNTKACEETPEAVPEHNNELDSDENTTQRFFEGGNSEEIQTIHLPEEVEVFKSSEAGGGEYSLMSEGSTEESKKELQVGTLQFAEDTEKPKSDNVNLELDHFSKEEKVELLDTSMKTEIKQSDEEFETELEDEDETAERETNKLPQDVCEKRNAVAADEGVDSADETPESPKSEEGKMTQISLGPELVQAFRLEDDREIKPQLFDESATELPQVRFDTEEQEYVDEGQPEYEVLDLNEITTLHLVGTASDLITGQSALSQCQITADTETADESKATLGEITNEPQQTEKHSEDPAEEHQDGIDEEILDLWIETAMSKDTGGIKEDQLKEEPGETSSEETREGVMEAISEETETSFTTLDSGFLDQTFSETQIIKSGDSGVLPNKNDNSEDTCEVRTSNSESALIEEMVETLQPYPIAEGASGEIGSCPDSGVSSPEPKHPNQEGGTAEEKQDEPKPETDAVSGANEEADVTSLTEATESDISKERVLTESPFGGEPQNEPEEKPPEDLSESFPAPSRTELEEDWTEVDAAMLDFAVQKSRIAVKNPRARPPTDPRSLIHKPSVDPTPSLPVPGKVPVGVPLGGLGIGIKLPGIGAGFPVLKKTQRPPRHEAETQSQESEEKKEEEEKNDAAKTDEAPKRPKWMPPAQPGFGNPLMSELKTKLKKTPKE
ncbi:titin homolog isoform X2 [Xiphophorus hellerii]|uniref:titin homolog isoform X2 n=1 Tax=Xiphophorus hellerii TaxID=8084 RepID=UPI0013B4371B|nr:titin homolog isoform X2 [Xiphophorus hellerii]